MPWRQGISRCGCLMRRSLTLPQMNEMENVANASQMNRNEEMDKSARMSARGQLLRQAFNHAPELRGRVIAAKIMVMANARTYGIWGRLSHSGEL